MERKTKFVKMGLGTSKKKKKGNRNCVFRVTNSLENWKSHVPSDTTQTATFFLVFFSYGHFSSAGLFYTRQCLMKFAFPSSLECACAFDRKRSHYG